MRYLEFINKTVKLKRKELLKDYEKLQGARNVQFILNDEDPFGVTNKILEGLYRNAKATLSDSVHLSSCRWAVALDIELVCPLRIANLAKLSLLDSNTERKSLGKFEKEKSIGIYFNQTKSCYFLFVHKAHLKNRKSDTVNNIHVNLEHLTSKIEHLIEKRDEFFDKNPHFKSDYIIGFRTQSGHGDSINSRAAASAFKRITAKVIQAYFPEAKSEGINPHGMRHLVASLYLRDHPEHFLALATLLMDSISTVMETYAHRDDNLNAKKISSWGAGRFGTPNV